jgi:hypothetical protein
VSAVETALAVLFVALGVRSVVYWSRRPVEARDRRDHALFAVFVTGRAGVWFAIAGLFALYAGIPTRGRAFIDDAREYDWLLVVFLVLAALQTLAGFLLSRRADR